MASSTSTPSSSVFSLFSLKGKTAIVSGGGAGLGLAIVHALAEAGANVAILYLSNKKAVERAKEVEAAYGVKCQAYHLDVTHQPTVETTIDRIVSEFNGRLDIFIANSGIPWGAHSAIDSPISRYREVMATNLDSVYYCAVAAGRHWRRQAAEQTTLGGQPLEGPSFREGSFVATASMSGHIVNVPNPQAAYNASKAAVIHLCKSLAVEWVGFARANVVSPGYVDSGLTESCPEELKELVRGKTPMRRIGNPDEFKGAYLYLASDASSFTTGADLVVDGGYTLI